MSKIRYETRPFNDANSGVVTTAGNILEEYARQGYRMSLRGLYYQFIRRDLFPESWRDKLLASKNVQKNYKRLSTLMTDARVSGLIDWAHIEDTTRDTQGGDFGYLNPAERISMMPDGYQITKWDGQPEYVEVAVEKEALLSIVGRPARRWNVTAMACKGNPSTSSVHEMAQRLKRIERTGRKTTLIYLGDHDPTGLDISRDVQDRLVLFRSSCTVDRIALNYDQITDDLPPSPAKLTDSRTSAYVEEFGEDTWELDALEPAVLNQLVEDAILARLDMGLWNERVRQENRDLVELEALRDNWTDVREYMDREGLFDYTSADDADAEADDDDEDEDL